jgi:hypothetical protein
VAEAGNGSKAAGNVPPPAATDPKVPSVPEVKAVNETRATDANVSPGPAEAEVAGDDANMSADVNTSADKKGDGDAAIDPRSFEDLEHDFYGPIPFHNKSGSRNPDLKTHLGTFTNLGTFTPLGTFNSRHVQVAQVGSSFTSMSIITTEWEKPLLKPIRKAKSSCHVNRSPLTLILLTVCSVSEFLNH